MITDLAPTRLSDLPAQHYRAGAPVPQPDGRADALHLSCGVADLATLATALGDGGPRVRIEATLADTWPTVDIESLVAHGAVELRLTGSVAGAGWVRLVALLVAAREHGLAVEWALPADRPEWVTADVLLHLPPPVAGDADEIARWSARHQFGQLYWRRGPGFVTVVDARGESRIRYVIDEKPVLALFESLAVPRPITGLSGEMDDLSDAALVVQQDGWAVRLPYRLRHTPMPGYHV
jgi:hypothetical protein